MSSAFGGASKLTSTFSKPLLRWASAWVTWISYELGYSNQNGGFTIIPFLVGVIVAVVLIAAYLGITGRRGSRRKIT